MNEQAFQIINKILVTKFPDAEVRQEVLSSVSTIVISETLTKVIDEFQDEAMKVDIATFIKEGNVEKVFKLCNEAGVDIEKIFEDRARSVVMDILK